MGQHTSEDLVVGIAQTQCSRRHDLHIKLDPDEALQ